MKRYWLLILGLLVATIILLFFSRGAAGSVRPREGSVQLAAASDLADGVVLVAGNTVDFQWTAGNHAGWEFSKWKLVRDPGAIVVHPDDPTLTTVFVRDTGVAPGQKYTYIIYNHECWLVGTYPYTKVCDWRSNSTWDVDTSVLSGQVTRDVSVPAATYTGNLFVQPGATLTMSSGTTVNGHSQISARGGALHITGVQFQEAYIQFGQWDRGTSGAGFVQDCTFSEGNQSIIAVANDSADVEIDGNAFRGGGRVTVDGRAAADVYDNTGIEVWLDGTASAYIAGNTGSRVLLRGDNTATIEDNVLSEGVYLNGAGSEATVRHNTIATSEPTIPGEEGRGIFAYDATKVTVEDNTLKYTGPASEYGTLVIYAEGSANLIARRNSVMGGIVAWDQAAAVLTENVVTVGSLQLKSPGVSEVTGNTVQAAEAVNFYREVPKAAVITNNCFRNLNLWVYVEDRPGAGNLNLRGNYWGDASGPTHGANPPGNGTRLKGWYVDFDPWDKTGAMCRDTPPEPPVEVGSLALSAVPSKIIPDGTTRVWLTARALTPEGEPAQGVPVILSFEPGIGRFDAGDRCTTGDDGRCHIGYVSPPPLQVNGARQITFTASASGLFASAALDIDYLRVTEMTPAHGTRNVDLHARLLLAGTFDRAINPGTLTADRFTVRSSVYFDRVNCDYATAGATVGTCTLTSDLADDARAANGLILTVRLLGGPGGIRGADGSFLAQDVTWQVYTTPKLAPSIVAVQVADGADLIGSKPAVVRVLGGLSDDTELDWVEARVQLTYEDLGAVFTRPLQRFYPGQTGPNEAYLSGNSANFDSRRGEVPLTGPGMTGVHALTASVEPVNQLSPPGGVARRYEVAAAVTVRSLGGSYARLLFPSYPIVPTDQPLHEFPYPWQVGQEIPAARTSPAVVEGKHYVEKWTPLWGIDRLVGTRGSEVWAPLVPNPKNDGQWYLAKLVRHADWQAVPLVPSGVYVLLLVPWQWMQTVNAGVPTYHGPAQHVCVTALDAPADFNPAATLAWCVGHLHGLPDAASPAGHTLRGFDQERGRLVDSEFAATGYRLSVMGFDRTAWGAGLHNLWIDTAGYQALMQGMAGSTAAASASAPDVITLIVGGEIVRQGGAETGAIDIVELPARRGGLPAIDGLAPVGDAFTLRFLDGLGQVLAERSLAPEFVTLRPGFDYASFLHETPAPTGLRSIVLLHGSTVLSTAAASLNVPEVSFQAPAEAASYSGLFTAQWTGKDADGDKLAYTLLYSPDNGQNWQAVALSTEATQAVVDTAQYSSCTQCRLKVIANDGFYSATALSVVFSASNPPRVITTWPAAGSTDAPAWPTLAASFRDAMNAASITTSTFTLVDAAGQAVPATVTYSAASRTALLQPALQLQNGRSYTARLAGSIKAVIGAMLGADVVWVFTVEDEASGATYLPLLRR